MPAFVPLKVGVSVKAPPVPEVPEIPKVPKIPEIPEEFEPIILVVPEEKIEISEESLIQYQAVIGEPVKWKKQFTTETITGFSVELPKGSENIKVKKIEDKKKEDITDLVDISKKLFSRKIKIEISKKTITGGAIADNSNSISYEIEYETPAPEIFEEKIARGKRVTITGPDEIRWVSQ